MTSASDIMVQVLVDFALRQNNESPWYGSVNLLLSQELNRLDQKKLTVVVPQMVLAATLDADLDDDQDSPILIHTSPDPLDTFLVATTTTPSPCQHGIAPSSSQRDAPSPSHRMMAPLIFQRSTAPSTPQGGPSPQARGSPDPLILSYSPASIRAVRKTLQKLQDITSRRIPDFVRLRFYNYNTVNVSHRVDLIIEVKRLPTDRAERDVLSHQAQMQVDEQAYHAFQLGPDSRLLKLGCLTILGNEWMYKEIGREGVSPPKGARDSTYQPSDISSDRSSVGAEPRTPPRRNQGNLRFGIPPPPPAPNPEDMTLVQEQYLGFTGSSALERQRKMLKLIRKRLDEIDQTMVGSYTQT